jgi:hypothetical protein
MRILRICFAPEGAGGGGAGGGGAGDGGAGATDFLATLPEDIRGDTSLKDIRDLAGLAKGYVNAQRMVGYDKVAIPGEKATPDEFNAFYTKLGRPEKPEGYKLPEVKADNVFQPPKELVTGFTAKAHELGISQKQAEGLFSWYLGQGNSSIEKLNTDLATTRDAGVAELKKEFGAAFDTKVNIARDAVRSLGDEAFVQFLDTSRLGDHPSMIRVFAKIGEMLKEEGTLKGTGTGSAMSPDEAKARIAEFNSNPDKMKAYTDKSHPNFKAVSEERARLYAYAYPESN